MMYIGTCGFSYKDWIGTFYPAGLRQERMLAYYAEHFDAVEIDASYYGVLASTTIARMSARTPERFRFCFKVPQTVSHPPDPGGRVHGDARAFVESLAPVAQAGKLGCALLQLANGFRPSNRTQAYLRAAVEALHPLPVVAEFRNREWQAPKYHEMLHALGAGWCNVDMPGYETLMRPSADATSAIGYVRFHGRNASKWWTGDNKTRYDYDYTAEELAPWTGRVRDIAEATSQTYVFFNNHARGNAPRNAELFEQLLGIRRERSRPPAQDSLFD